MIGLSHLNTTWLLCLPSPLVVCLCWFGCEGEGFLFMVHSSCSFNDVKVHLAMAPDAVVLNLHADALTVICNEKYQRRRPTTGITVAHLFPPFGATAVGLTQPAPTAYPSWRKLRCTAWPHQLPS